MKVLELQAEGEKKASSSGEGEASRLTSLDTPRSTAPCVSN